MVKMLSPGFPPRRPSGFARYILLAGIVLILFYMFHGGSDNRLSYPEQSKSVPDTTSDEYSNTKLRPEVKLPGSKSTGQDKLETDTSKPPKSGSKTGSTTQLDDEDIVDYDFSSPKFQEEEDDDDYRPAKTGGSDSDADKEYDYLAATKAGSSSKSKATGASKSTGSKTATGADEDEEDDSKSTSTGSSKSKTGGSKTGSSKADEVEEEDSASSKKQGGSSKSKQTSASNFANEEGGHPIDKLIYDAQHTFAELLSKESKSLDQAAKAYRKRRGRHPPPGFDKWYEFATQNKAVIVEEFFDQIYHDLEPFWGLPPKVIRKESSDFEMTINIRDGKASAGSDWFWTKIWLNLISTIEHLLPDMDLALNAMDEPRLVAPWEDINTYMKKAAKTRGFPKSSEVISKFQNLSAPGTFDKDVETRDKAWEGTKPYWPVARRGCAPDSPARETAIQKSFKEPPVINASNADPHSYQGYVSNFTLSAELCHQPDLQGLEGILINPLTTSASKVFFPMFGGSKLTVNNEILLPAPMYWNEEERFTGGDDHGVEWKNKEDKVIWRGVATGGKNTPDNWRGFQRHRFIAMNNGTTVSRVEAGKEEPENFALPPKQYNIKAQKDNTLGDWINEWSDCSFIDMMCEPPTEDGTCSYTEHYFHITPGLKMSEQFNNKYLPDIDGNSFSGRYLGFLRSTSLPVKATIWREWHDSRIVAWKHFVPMDSRFGDWYGIMDYFIGYNGKDGHDRAAEKIATEGKEWAEQVLRKEDMQIYVLRLLLEYARLLDDSREDLGWVGDAIKDPSIEKTWTSD